MSTDNAIPLTGLDLTFKSVENVISQKSDVIVTLVHWYLIIKADYKCLGIGTEKTIGPTEEENASDLLPDGWNEGVSYSIRYIKNGELYILTGAKSEDIFVSNLLNVKTQKVSNLVINIEETVAEIKGQIRKMIPEYMEIIQRIKKDLVESIENKAVQTTPTPREDPLRERYPGSYEPDPLRIGPPRRPNFGGDPLRGIGSGDLDPFGGLGGGMIFDPRRPQLPRYPGPGFVPGARFDEFNPFGLGADPDPDHFVPPSRGGGGGRFNPDMFM